LHNDTKFKILTKDAAFTIFSILMVKCTNV